MTEKEKRLTKKLQIEKWSLRFLILLFSTISFYTSYTGLIKLSGVEAQDYVLKTFIAILIVGIQFALVFSINSFYIKDLIRRNWFKAIALLCIYSITMIVSVTFSFSYWYEDFSAKNYAKRNSELQLNKVKKSLIEAKGSFLSMEQSLTKLSNYSTTKSQYEKTFGGTCSGVPRIGEGPFTWLRADDATYTKSYSSEIKKLQKSLKVEIEEVSKYLETFKPKGDIGTFNRTVNDKITEININFFNNPILQSLKSMLLERSGKNRQQIHVLSKKTGNTSKESCIDRDFTFGANRVIKLINSLKPINTLTFFDMNDTNKLFGRTTAVLIALIDPSYKIKDTDKISSPTDITYDDIYAVSAGFVIDFLILLITLYGKDPKEDLVPITVVKDILNGKYSKKILSKLRLFLAELDKSHLLAVPNDADDETIENLKVLILYMQQHKLAKLYINERKADRLDKYFSKNLRDAYPDSTFRIYRINKKKFNKLILQNVLAGADDV